MLSTGFDLKSNNIKLYLCHVLSQGDFSLILWHTQVMCIFYEILDLYFNNLLAIKVAILVYCCIHVSTLKVVLPVPTVN